MDVAEGDTVVYSKYGGTEITVEGEDLLILNAVSYTHLRAPETLRYLVFRLLLEKKKR